MKLAPEALQLRKDELYPDLKFHLATNLLYDATRTTEPLQHVTVTHPVTNVVIEPPCATLGRITVTKCFEKPYFLGDSIL